VALGQINKFKILKNLKKKGSLRLQFFKARSIFVISKQIQIVKNVHVLEHVGRKGLITTFWKHYSDSNIFGYI